MVTIPASEAIRLFQWDVAESLTNPVLLPLILTAIVSVVVDVAEVVVLISTSKGSEFPVVTASRFFLQAVKLTSSKRVDKDGRLIFILD